MKIYGSILKKIFFIVSVLLLILLLSTCVGPYKFNHQTDDWENVDIEIVKIEGSISSTHYTNVPYKQAYTDEQITVIARIDDNEKFIDELLSLRSYRPFGDPYSSITGKAIRITYTDSKIEIITSNGSALVTNSEVDVKTKTFDDEQFDDFLNKWIF